MLVIRRKAGESILIGGDIEIEVTEVSGPRVKLGIRAPRQTLILRKELLATGQENQRAALSLGHAGWSGLLGHLSPATLLRQHQHSSHTSSAQPSVSEPHFPLTTDRK